MLTEDLHLEPDRDGWTSLHQAWAVPPMGRHHRHEELEVNLVVHGWAEYLVSGRRVRFPPHGLGWLLPCQPHRLIDRSPDLQMWIGVFRPAMVAPDTADASGTDGADDADDVSPPRTWLHDAPDDALVRVVSKPDARALAGVFEQLLGPAISARRHRAGLAWLLSECWRTYRSATVAPSGEHLHPAVELAARWLFDHASEPEANDLDALAARCKVSRPWLSTLFQQQLGESITDFRNKQRLQRFRELLAQPRPLSMTEASFAAGFGSYAQCYRTVRRYTGRSPNELVGLRDDAHGLRATAQ